MKWGSTMRCILERVARDEKENSKENEKQNKEEFLTVSDGGGRVTPAALRL